MGEFSRKVAAAGRAVYGRQLNHRLLFDHQGEAPNGIRFHHRCDRAMTTEQRLGAAKTPAREGDFTVSTDTKHAAGAFINESGKTIASPPTPATVDEAAAPAKKKTVAAKPKTARASKPRKAARQPRRSSRAASKAEKLVCRYCGSDDLSPSFKKRRDARCRACFKKRYGSPARGKKATRARKAKPAK